MGHAWSTFREAGWLAWVMVPIAVAGVACALTALVAAVRRSPRALRLGSAAVAAGALCAALGGLGVVRGRARTDRAMAEYSRPVLKERDRREGYRRARSAAAVGLALAAFPLLVGVLAALAAPRKRPEDADLPPGVLPPLRLAIPLSVTAAGAFFAWLGVEAMRARIPGRAFAADDPIWETLDTVERLRAARSRPEIVRSCERLGELLDGGAGARAAAEVPDLRKLGSGCVVEMLGQAMAKPLAAAMPELEALTKSYFVKTDPVEEQRVQTHLLTIPVQREPEKPKVKPAIGEMTVKGTIDRAYLAESVRRATRLLERCYEAWDGSYEGTEGEVVIRFDVDSLGYAKDSTEVSSTIADPELRRCVRYAFSLHAGRPRGAVSVVVPVRFAAVPAATASP